MKEWAIENGATHFCHWFQPMRGMTAEKHDAFLSFDEKGEPVDLVKVRALMIPPGIPDFLTRIRLVQPGTVTLTGRAWAGRITVSRVETSGDGGATWTEATLGEEISPYAWRSWTSQWEATPGRHTLWVRATDAQGNRQPTEQEWNLQGMGNNMVQQVDVLVE